MSDKVDTKAAEHRSLRFGSVDQCLSEVERIRIADQQGKLRASGNWSPGQNLSHLAAWIEYAYEGFPVGPPPFFIRWILKWQLPKMLREGMPRGVRIPRVEGGTTGADDVPTQQACDRLCIALNRLQSDEPAPHDSPPFGPLSHEDRIRLNLRHAELHLGFLHIESD